MIKLVVNNFSSIRKADLEIRKINVIIGPQSSGKSVLCKLVYFFIFALQQVKSIIYEVQDISIEDLLKNCEEQFSYWFPTSTWNSQKFEIRFEIGVFWIKLNNFADETGALTRINIKLSRDLRVFLEERQNDYNRRISEKTLSILNRSKLEDKFEKDFEKILRKILLDDYIFNQIFVPAGRSIFNMLEKGTFILENARFHDPLTFNFAKILLAIRNTQVASRNEIRHARKQRKDLSFVGYEKLIGGRIYVVDSSYYLETDDMRNIPFSNLSSGQSEVIPLILILNELNKSPKDNYLVFVEEPEAHLFPESQAKLVEKLVGLFNKGNNRLMITTHSPYILTKLNNFIKANELNVLLDLMVNHDDLSNSLNKTLKKQLNEIINSDLRINSEDFKAYALKDGVLSNIVDQETNLINGEYLDSVSDIIGDEFDQLVDLEWQLRCQESDEPDAN